SEFGILSSPDLEGDLKQIARPRPYSSGPGPVRAGLGIADQNSRDGRSPARRDAELAQSVFRALARRATNALCCVVAQPRSTTARSRRVSPVRGARGSSHSPGKISER